MSALSVINFDWVVTRMDTPKYVYKVPTDLSSLTKGLPSLIMV